MSQGTGDCRPAPELPPERRSAVLRQALSVGVATGAYGVSFGAVSVASGLTVGQTMALSLVLFSGGSQFALVGILGAGGSGGAAIAASTLLGVRNCLYGLQVAGTLATRGVRRVAAAQLTIDESTAVSIGQPEGAAQRLGFWVTGTAVYILWNLMTLLGALVGAAMGDPRAYGLDAAAAAAFGALLWPRLRSRESAGVAVLAGLLALVLAPSAPPGIPVLAAALAAVAGGLLPRRGAGPE